MTRRATPNDLEQLKRITRTIDSAARAAAEAAAGAGAQARLTFASIADAGRPDETANHHADMTARFAEQAARSSDTAHDCEREAGRIFRRSFAPETNDPTAAAVSLLVLAIKAQRRAADAHAHAAHEYAQAAAQACRPAEQEAATE